MTDLKLIALDTEDLQVISAHVQDAVVRVGDIAYVPDEKRLAAVINRFDWSSDLAHGQVGAGRQGRSAGGQGGGDYRRRRSGLRFERVEAVRALRIDPKRSDDVLALLAITFQQGEAPAGTITLNFSGGMAMELDVECIEAELRDLSAAWTTPHRPQHDDGA